MAGREALLELSPALNVTPPRGKIESPFQTQNIIAFPNVKKPESMVFSVASPFKTSRITNQPSKTLEDEGFDVEVVTAQEKPMVVSNLTTRQERIRSETGNVVSLFKEALDYKITNIQDFRTLTEQAAVTARLQAAACAPGDGHGGLQTNSFSLSGETSIGSKTMNISKFGSEHKSEKHDHCSHGKDYGECLKGCKKTA